MSGINKAIVLGRLGKDPELKYTASGMAWCKFTVATSEQWTDKTTNTKQEKTQWHNITVWGKLAEICNQYLQKGRQVYLEGKMDTQMKENQDGTKTYFSGIIADKIEFVGNAPAAGEGGRPANNEPTPPQDTGYNNNFTADDIPF